MKKFFLAIWESIYPLIIYLVVQVVVLLISGEASKYLEQSGSGKETGGVLLATGIAGLITIPIMFILYMADNRNEGILIREYLKETRLLDYVFIALTGAGLALCLNILISFAGFVQEDGEFAKLNELLHADGWPVLMLMGGVILPIVEEMIFRALIYKRLRDKYNIAPALIASSLLFGLFHFNLTQLVYASALGIVLALIYEKWENIFLCMLFHVSANTFVLCISYATQAMSIDTQETNLDFPAMMLVFAVVLVCIIVSIGGTVFILKHRRPEIARYRTADIGKDFTEI